MNLVTRVPPRFHAELLEFLDGRMTPGRWLSLVVADHVQSGRKLPTTALRWTQGDQALVRILGWGSLSGVRFGGKSRAEWLWAVAWDALVVRKVMPVDLEPQRSHTSMNQHNRVEVDLKITRDSDAKVGMIRMNLGNRREPSRVALRRAFDRGLELALEDLSV